MRPAFLAVLGSLVAAPAAAQAITPPPDAPATVELRDTLLILRYHGAKIFEGTIVTAGGPASFRELTDTTDGRVTQVLKWTAPDDGRITITGLVRGSPELPHAVENWARSIRASFHHRTGSGCQGALESDTKLNRKLLSLRDVMSGKP